MKINKVTDKNREEYIAKYAEDSVDSLDFSALWEYAYGGVYENLKKYTNEELEKEMTEFYTDMED